MIKLTAVSILTLFFLHSSPALALEYTVLRDQNKPASSKVLASTTKSLEDTGLVSLDVDGFGEVPIEWVDQIWASPNMDQAIFIKFDLKPKDETLLGKTIKMKTALLIHGQQASGSYFAVYFSGFDEKSAKNYYQKILNTKLQPNQGAWNTLFMIPSAYAEQTNSCGTKTTGMFKGLYSVVKEYRWTCLKSFVKVAFGSIIGAVAGTVLGVLDGTIWTKVGTNWSFITSVISAISKTTGALKDLDYLPLKDRAQFICEALGKGVNSASGSFSGGASATAIKEAVSRFIKQVTTDLYQSGKYRKIIEENKIKKQTFCVKPTTKKEKEPVPGTSNASHSESATKSGKNSNLGQ